MHKPTSVGGASGIEGADGHPTCGDARVSATILKSVSQGQGIQPIAEGARTLRIKLPTLRDIHYHAEERRNARGEVLSGNGYGPAFLKLGRSVYVDVDAFIVIWRSKARGDKK